MLGKSWNDAILHWFIITENRLEVKNARFDERGKPYMGNEDRGR